MSKLQLLYPLKPWVVTQPFGVNGDYYRSNGINIIGHNGLDVKASDGQPIYAAHDGVAYYEIDSNQGHGVIVITNEQFDKGTTQAYYKSIYWHMMDSAKFPQFRSPVENYQDLSKPGLPVKAGDLIGYADNTGLSTGTHTHFGLKAQALQYPNEYVTEDLGNGYLGALDPTPFFNGQFAVDLHKSVVNPFLTDMKYGDYMDEVERLQRILAQLGYFHGDFYPRYGSITQGAVYGFQLDYVKMNWFEKVFLRGSRCGSKTRKSLNNIISKQYE